MRDGKVVMTVRGHHTAAHARGCAAAVKSAFERIGTADLVIDLREMASFERDARVHWQDELFALRRRITGIVIAGGPPLARMAGAAVCLFVGIKMRVVGAPDEAFVSAA